MDHIFIKYYENYALWQTVYLALFLLFYLIIINKCARFQKEKIYLRIESLRFTIERCYFFFYIIYVLKYLTDPQNIQS